MVLRIQMIWMNTRPANATVMATTSTGIIRLSMNDPKLGPSPGTKGHLTFFNGR
jgi:hypothetical protein